MEYKMRKNFWKVFVLFFIILGQLFCTGEMNASASNKVKSITLSKSNLTVEVGKSKKLTVVLKPALKRKKITWSSNNKNVAFVKNGKVTGVSVGTATITAKVDGKKAKCKVKVTLGKKAKKAINEYKNYLGKKKIKWGNKYADSKYAKFMLNDVNADGIPELFIDMSSAGNKFPLSYADDWQKIYCYNNGKITEVGGGHNIISYYPLSGIVSIGTALSAPIADQICYYKISKDGKSSMIAYSTEYAIESYGADYWFGKYMTKSEFDKILRKTVGKKKIKIKENEWYKNTANNRKKISKLVKW